MLVLLLTGTYITASSQLSVHLFTFYCTHSCSITPDHEFLWPCDSPWKAGDDIPVLWMSRTRVNLVSHKGQSCNVHAVKNPVPPELVHNHRYTNKALSAELTGLVTKVTLSLYWVMMCEHLGFCRLFILQGRDSPNTTESNKLLWQFWVLHKPGGATTGETDCRLFCVQRGNRGCWMWRLD